VSDFGRPWNSTEPADSYRKWFPVFIDHSTFDIVGFGEEAIGLSTFATLDLKRKVLAAAIATKLRISLSYAEKRYVGTDDISAPRELGLSHMIDNLFDQGHSRFCSYIDSLKESFDDDTETLDDLSNQFFYRNMAGLEAAKKLSDLGYLCEVAVILRSLVEQFAFAAKLRTLPIETEIEKVKPVQCLNYLKSVERTAGKLYGLLSKYTHFEFDHHTHFFGRSPEAVFTIQKDSVLRAYSTHLIFLTMLSMAKYVLSVGPTQFDIIPESVSQLEDFTRGIAAYSKEVCDLFPSDRVLANFDYTIRTSIQPNSSTSAG
jgi:hypothetical protein